MLLHSREERPGIRHVLDDLEEADNVKPICRGGKVFDGGLSILQALRIGRWAQKRVASGMLFRNGQDVRGGVDRGDQGRAREARGGLSEDAAATADVQIAQLLRVLG